MQTKSDRAWFERHLRAALTSLYDPSVLRSSPLAELFGVGQRGDLVSALRHILIDAIESLRPNKNTPLGSKTWRIYQVLRRRYTEQLTQLQVASDLSLSVRQLQREEKLAREVLADYLWAAHNLDSKERPISVPAEAGDQADARILTRQQELEWLRNSVSAQIIRVGEVIQEVLHTLAPLLASSKVSAEYVAREDLPRISLQPPMLRQALLNVISTAIRCAPGGQVRVEAEAFSQQVCIHVRATTHDDSSPYQQQEHAESLEMAEQLVRLSYGSLEVTMGAGGEEAFSAKFTFPVTEQMTVLVIDDNADALQLFKRYLSGSRYRFIGAQDARQGLALAEESAPQIIVLDVMMPREDGWTLLGQLREHPRTNGIPILVCTILPQEQLALTLGAAGFIRKPISRTEFLSALDRQLDRSLKDPG